MLDDLKEKMEGEIYRREFTRFVMKITWFMHTSIWTLKLVYKLAPVSQLLKIFLLLFTLKENYCHQRRFLIWWKKKSLIHVHSLTCLLSPRQAHSDNISKSLFDITSFIDSAAEDIENDSTMDEVTTGKMLVLIEQFMTILAVTLLTPILI